MPPAASRPRGRERKGGGARSAGLGCKGSAPPGERVEVQGPSRVPRPTLRPEPGPRLRSRHLPSAVPAAPGQSQSTSGLGPAPFPGTSTPRLRRPPRARKCPTAPGPIEGTSGAGPAPSGTARTRLRQRLEPGSGPPGSALSRECHCRPPTSRAAFSLSPPAGVAGCRERCLAATPLPLGPHGKATIWVRRAGGPLGSFLAPSRTNPGHSRPVGRSGEGETRGHVTPSAWDLVGRISRSLLSRRGGAAAIASLQIPLGVAWWLTPELGIGALDGASLPAPQAEAERSLVICPRPAADNKQNRRHSPVLIVKKEKKRFSDRAWSPMTGLEESPGVASDFP